MHVRERSIKTKGIIFRKTPFKESSLILEVFSKDMGKISVIAKGIKKEKSKSTGLIEILNELEFVLHKSSASEWYILKSQSLIKAYLFETDFQTNVVMQAAVEIYRQMIISEIDAENYYDLLITYFDFLPKIRKNKIAIFWRFLLRIFKESGIEMNVQNCIICFQNKSFVSFYPLKNGFVCKECNQRIMEEAMINISSRSAEIFQKLEIIGKVIDEIEISKNEIKQINRIFLVHLSEHFHKRFHLKSLEMYK
ncbi:MAG TPA: DNA repair protein RecO [Candidatus Cloacimonetes bacterium]|nr:DNA repair protein RecO [Candidatus Cloacimonadota bacterium]